MRAADGVIVMAILVLAIAIWDPDPRPAPVPTPVPTPVDRELQDLVLPIEQRLDGDDPKAQLLEEFYAALASAVDRDGGKQVCTLADFRLLHVNALNILTVERDLLEPQVGPLVDAAIITRVGADPAGKVADVEPRLVEVLQAISQACGRAADG